MLFQPDFSQASRRRLRKERDCSLVGTGCDPVEDRGKSNCVPWVLSIMPNLPVRDQWEYQRKMERHFPIKLGQPIGMALATVCFPAEFPN